MKGKLVKLKHNRQIIVNTIKAQALPHKTSQTKLFYWYQDTGTQISDKIIEFYVL